MSRSTHSRSTVSRSTVSRSTHSRSTVSRTAVSRSTHSRSTVSRSTHGGTTVSRSAGSLRILESRRRATRGRVLEARLAWRILKPGLAARGILESGLSLRRPGTMLRRCVGVEHLEVTRSPDFLDTCRRAKGCRNDLDRSASERRFGLEGEDAQRPTIAGGSSASHERCVHLYAGRA